MIFSKEEIFDFLMKMTHTLMFLEQNHIVHSNINPFKILLNKHI